MDKAIARVSVNEVSPVKISFNDIVLKSVASAIRQHPDVNVSWLKINAETPAYTYRCGSCHLMVW